MALPLDERNIQIYLDKMGYKSVKDKTPVRTPITYRVLMTKYNLSLKRLQDIVNRERMKLLMEGK